MRQFGLIGYPLSHSFSKKYFTEKFQHEGIPGCAYENYPIASINELNNVLHGAPAPEGLNVTIPYKESVLPFLHYQSEVVREIKACNCIKISNGRLSGYNTDVTGFEISLREQLQPHHRNALILGTGGAAKAVEWVLRKLGISYQYVSRQEKQSALGYEQVTPALLENTQLIINTTPLGMYPAVDNFPPIPYEALGHQHYLFDLVYNPARTLFLQKGEARGASVKNGQDMLVIQAEESWRIWNDSTL